MSLAVRSASPGAAASPDPPAPPQRDRVVGLDGIRGLAALFVVVNHAFLRSFPGYPVDTAPFWAGWLIYGRFAVVVFIVLSGFSLAVSAARSGWRLGGVAWFAQRRAWRILPPYWAALAYSLVVAWLIMPQPGQAMPNAGSVVVNGLLLQDVLTAPSPNRAFWTIAIEAQLYVVFPVLLLVARRVNALVMLAAVTLLVATVGVLAPPAIFPTVAPDFAALFATGVLAAGILSASQRVRSWPWPWLALAAAVPVLATIAWQGSVWTIGHLFWVDLAFGPAIGCLLAAVATGRPRSLVRGLQARPLRSLGSFSYSLYLTHAPLVVILYEGVVAGRVPRGVPSFLLSLVIIVPATIVFARLFAAGFERPFQRYRSWAEVRGALSNRVAAVAGFAARVRTTRSSC